MSGYEVRCAKTNDLFGNMISVWLKPMTCLGTLYLATKSDLLKRMTCLGTKISGYTVRSAKTNDLSGNMISGYKVRSTKPNAWRT